MILLDVRLRAAIDASIGWYDAICALHGVRCGVEDGTWIAYDRPPPLHSIAKIVEPGIGSGRALTALADHGGGAVADSFGELDLSGDGLTLLFDARWIYLDTPKPPSNLPPGWSTVTTTTTLSAWTAHNNTTAVLLPGLLNRSTFRVLTRQEDETPVVGVVARLGTGVVEVSNVWATPEVDLDWSEVVAAVAAVYPGRAMVGWAHDTALAQARDAGFTEVGPQRVWVTGHQPPDRGAELPQRPTRQASPTSACRRG